MKAFDAKHYTYLLILKKLLPGKPSAIVTPQFYYPIFQNMYNNANYTVPDLPGMGMLNGANAIMRGSAIFWDNVMQTILPNSQSTTAPIIPPVGIPL